jgi:hypothetical protein
MAKQVMNKATGVNSDVPDNHWALTSSDFIVIEEAPKEEKPDLPKFEVKPKAKKE